MFSTNLLSFYFAIICLYKSSSLTYLPISIYQFLSFALLSTFLPIFSLFFVLCLSTSLSLSLSLYYFSINFLSLSLSVSPFLSYFLFLISQSINLKLSTPTRQTQGTISRENWSNQTCSYCHDDSTRSNNATGHYLYR